ALQRGYLQGEGREIVEYDLPGGQGLHRGLGLHVALAAVADLDLACGFPLFRREVAEVDVIGFGAKGTPQPRDLPPRGAPAAAQPALPLEPPELRQRWPRPAHGTIAFPPGRRHLRRERATTGLQQGKRGHLSDHAQLGRFETGVILTERRLEQLDRLERAIGGGEVEYLAHPAVQDTPAHRDL